MYLDQVEGQVEDYALHTAYIPSSAAVLTALFFPFCLIIKACSMVLGTSLNCGCLTCQSVYVRK